MIVFNIITNSNSVQLAFASIQDMYATIKDNWTGTSEFTVMWVEWRDRICVTCVANYYREDQVLLLTQPIQCFTTSFDEFGDPTFKEGAYEF